jgi:hypothetical protein
MATFANAAAQHQDKQKPNKDTTKKDESKK